MSDKKTQKTIMEQAQEDAAKKETPTVAENAKPVAQTAAQAKFNAPVDDGKKSTKAKTKAKAKEGGKGLFGQTQRAVNTNGQYDISTPKARNPWPKRIGYGLIAAVALGLIFGNISFGDNSFKKDVRQMMEDNRTFKQEILGLQASVVYKDSIISDLELTIEYRDDDVRSLKSDIEDKADSLYHAYVKVRNLSENNKMLGQRVRNLTSYSQRVLNDYKNLEAKQDSILVAYAALQSKLPRASQTFVANGVYMDISVNDDGEPVVTRGGRLKDAMPKAPQVDEDPHAQVSE